MHIWVTSHAQQQQRIREWPASLASEAVTSDPACRFQRENVMIVPQQRRAGYCYRTEGHSFVRQIDSEEHLCGSGYAMMQLAWHREAFTLGANLTAREFLPGSVLAALESRGVQ